MARQLFIFSKCLIFAMLLFIRAKEEELAPYFSQWGKLVAHSGRYADFAQALLNFLIFTLGLNLFIVFLSSIYRRRKGIRKGKVDNVLAGLDNIYILLMAGAVIVTLLSLFGVDPKNLFTGLSIVAAAIAIVTKDYIANIISGIIISFSSEISIGDQIEIGEHRGRILDISLSRIALLSDDEDIIYIPNNTIFTSEIVNFTKSGVRKVSIEFEVKIELVTTVEELEKRLIEGLSEYQGAIEEGTIRLRTENIGKDSVSMKFQFVLRQINRDLEREIRRKTVRMVVNYLSRNSVKI